MEDTEALKIPLEEVDEVEERTPNLLRSTALLRVAAEASSSFVDDGSCAVDYGLLQALTEAEAKCVLFEFFSLLSPTLLPTLPWLMSIHHSKGTCRG
jgi:hypothetical protein